MTRRVWRADNILDWLNDAPYDSTLGCYATIRIHTELVRASDSAVLWRGDTVDVRTMQTDSLVEEVEIPVATSAAPGTEVFVRLWMQVSEGLDPEVATVIEWSDGGSGMLKLAPQPGKAANVDAPGLLMEVLPNPSGSDAALLVRAPGAGELTLAILDARGSVVAVLPSQTVASKGDYTIPIRAQELPPGVYVVRGELGDDGAMARLVVVR